MYSGAELTVGRHDPRKVREAVRLPTVASFPDVKAVSSIETRQWSQQHPPNFSPLHMKFLYPSGIPQDLSPDVFQAINVKIKEPTDWKTFLSENEGEGVEATASCCVPDDWFIEPKEDQTQERLPAADSNSSLHNARPRPTRGDFWVRVKELMYENEDALRSWAKLDLINGDLPLRITHSRAVYEHLDGLIQFWDISMDHYFALSDDEPEDDDLQLSNSPSQKEPRKRARLTPILQQDAAGTILNIITPPNAHARRETMFERRTRIPVPPFPLGTYSGWRLDTGMNMPSSYRENLVKDFINMAFWPFGMSVDRAAPGQMPHPRLSIKNVRMMPGLTKRIWREGGNSRAEASKIIGPVLGMSCRSNVGFGEKKYLSDMDILREVGSAMLIAQERYRQGKSPPTDGPEKWWIHKPRFAGLDYEVPEEYKPSPEATAATAEPKKELASTHFWARKRLEGRQMTPKERAIKNYKDGTPGTPLWDRKATYARLGGPNKDGYDQVFLVSSINHHISFIKLIVSDAYLDCLETGKLPETENLDPNWSEPVVERTIWYDLISPKERTEAFRALWSIAAWVSLV